MGWSVLGSGPLNNTATWHPEPTTRGTWSIISTCLITLVLCIWSSVHLNIPRHDYPSSQFLRKSRWVLVGLLAPEVMVYVAFHQNRSALYLHKEMTENLDPLLSIKVENSSRISTRLRRFIMRCTTIKKASSGRSVRDEELGETETCDASHEREESRSQSTSRKQRRHPWTRTHSAYALMGGFAFDTTHWHANQPLDGSTSRVTISPSGLKFLAKNQPDLIPDISEDSIKDKSKANDGAKAFVGLQVIWFCGQMITRLATSLPITLLELNTFAHCLCVFLIYYFWWSKPFDIEEPSLIRPDTPRARRICAAMYMRSTLGMAKMLQAPFIDKTGVSYAYGIVEIGTWLRYPLDDVHARSRRQEKSDHPAKTNAARNRSASSPGFSLELCSPQHDISLRYVTKARNNNIYDTAQNWTYVYAPAVEDPHKPITSANSVRIPGELIDLCSLAKEGVLLFPDFEDAQAPRHRNKHRISDDYLWTHVSDFCPAIMDKLTRRDVGSTVIAIIFLLPLYGGVHLLAWDGPFRSKSEMIMWAVSAVALTAVTAIILLICGFVYMVYLITPRPDRSRQNRFERDQKIEPSVTCHAIDRVGRGIKRAFGFALLIIALVYALLYVLARVFLVVECFVSLPYAPAAAFLQPSWPAYLPHLG